MHNAFKLASLAIYMQYIIFAGQEDIKITKF